jgi:RNA polymerase sigma-54 factor
MFQLPSLRQRLSIRPLTTAHLAQTMSLLELTAAELNQKIEAELANNPALEVRESHRCPTCRRPLPKAGACPRCSATASLNPDEPLIFVSPRQDFYVRGQISPEDMAEDDMPQAVEDLPTFVLRQIAPELPPEDRPIAATILTNLDEDGFLEISLAEVARYHHVPLSRLQGVLRLIQRAEPVGVGSPSPREALLAQLEVLSETKAVPLLADKAIQEGMDLLSRRQYPELSRLLGIPTRQAKAIARFISDNLNPFPGRAYWGDIRQGKGAVPTVYTYPDVIITKMDLGPDPALMVEIASPYAGLLQINPLFRQAIGEAPADKADQWKSDLEHAELLVKCLQQRTHTVVRLMRAIVTYQRDFILKGDGHLQPLTRAVLAGELGVHESTISRAVASKTVQLPSGHIVPLSKFFDRSLHVRTALKQIIEGENQPYSDTELVELLNQQGYSVARRTVAKYRAMEGILPSHLRQARTRTEKSNSKGEEAPEMQEDELAGLAIEPGIPFPVFIPQEAG